MSGVMAEQLPQLTKSKSIMNNEVNELPDPTLRPSLDLKQVLGMLREHASIEEEI